MQKLMRYKGEIFCRNTIFEIKLDSFGKINSHFK